MDDASRVGEARRHAAFVAQDLDWTDVEAGRLALVVTELGTNLHRHARGGLLLIAARPTFNDVEVISIDEGPGIADMAQSMRDGYSTGNGSSPGTGLGAIRRLASEFDIHSTVPTGTVCVARVARPDRPRPQGAIEIGAVNVCAPHETVNGDGWAVAFDGSAASLLVADGLGHGPEAAKASAAATAVFVQQPFAGMAGLLGDLHTALQTTRGAAVCVLRIAEDTLRIAGAGNIATRVVSGVFDRSMVTQHGTVGLRIPRVHEASLALPPHAVVIAHSDGIETRWDPAAMRPLLGRDPALIAALLLRDHTRGRDDATVIVLRRAA